MSNNIENPNEITSITCYLNSQTAPNNPGYSGYGFYLIDNLNNTHKRYGAVTPNNGLYSDSLFSNIFSLINLLEYCTLYENLEEIKIYTDSIYLLKTLKSLITTKNHDDEIYKEHWNYISKLISKYSSDKISLNKSNPKDETSEIVNQLSNYGRLLSINNYTNISYTIINDEVDTISKERKKELEKITLPSLISGSKFFFLTSQNNTKYQDYYLYTTLSFDKDKDEPNFLLGTDAPDDHIGIVLTKEPIVTLEAIRERLLKFYKDVELPAISTLNLLSKIENKNFLLEEKDLFTTIVNNKCNLKNGVMICEIINPPLKAFNLIQICTEKLDVFEKYKNGEIQDLDITKHFFGKDNKDKLIIKPIFTNDTVKINIPIILNGTNYQLSILPNIDFPKRNNFVKMIKEEEDISIKLLYWDIEGKFLSSMIVIETKDKVGIYFTSKAFKKIAFN